MSILPISQFNFSWNDTDFIARNYLSKENQEVLFSISSSLKGQMFSKLLCFYDTELIKIAESILELFRSLTKTDHHAVLDAIISMLLFSFNEEAKSCLKILCFLKEKDELEPFLLSVAEKRVSIEDRDSLFKVLNDLNIPKKETSLQIMPVERMMINYTFQLTSSYINSYLLPSLNEKDVSASKITFSNFRQKILQYLSSIPNEERLPLKIYEDFFQLVEDDNQVGVNEKKLIIKLAVLATTTGEKEVDIECAKQDFKELVKQFKKLGQLVDRQFLYKFYKSVERLKKLSISNFINVCHLIASLRNIELQPSWFLKALPLIDDNLQKLTAYFQYVLFLYENKIEEKSFLLESLDPSILYQRFVGGDSSVKFPLKKKELDEIFYQFQMVEITCAAWLNLSHQELFKIYRPISQNAQKNSLSHEDIIKLIAIGRISLFRQFKTFAHSTQILALLGILNSKTVKDVKGRVAQIKTGEGKSLITSLLIFVLAAEDSVDVVSSDQNLSIRDQKKYQKFFESFGISTSHICYTHQKPSHFRAQVLYGTMAHFAFALMSDTLYNQKLFQERLKASGVLRNFKVVLVDEADNLMIDESRNSARLSLPSDENYAWVYGPILNFAKQHSTSLSKEQGFFSEKTLTELKKTISANHENASFNVSEHFSDMQLSTWLKSAYAALFTQKENINYIVRHHQTSDNIQDPCIEIIDVENTGRALEACRWGNGLHEFLEVKHSLEVKTESLTPISISAPILYLLYERLFALTGTLGSQVERDEIRKLYTVDSFDAPPHKPSLRMDAPPSIFKSEQDYMGKILSVVKTLQAAERPILTLCATILDTQKMAQLLSAQGISFQLLNETQNEKDEIIISRAGLPGTLTIATNTATRGVDILLDSKSLENGGLHVLLTFLPDSERVEEQAIGRAARQGQPGSSEILVLIDSDSQDHYFEFGKLLIEREIKRQLRAHTSIYRAKIERHFYHSYVKKFYLELNAWDLFFEKSNDLQRQSKSLSQTKFEIEKIATQPLLKNINIDPSLANLVRSLVEMGSKPLGWQILLKQVEQQIRDKTLKIWSRKFYQRADLLIHSQLIDSEETFDLIEKQLEKLYEENKALWQGYLKLGGILEHLKQVTGLNQ